MYPNFSEDRKSLGYELINDTSCGIKLVLITDSTVQLIKNLPSNAKYKTKRVILVITLASGFWFSNLESAEAMGSSLPPSQIVRVHKTSYDYRSEIKIAKTVSPKLDKIRFIASHKMIPVLYMDRCHGYGYINQKLLKTLRSRGGADVSSSLTLIAIGGVVFIICQLSGVDGFAILQQIDKWNAPTVDPGFGLNPYDVSKTSRPQTGLEMQKPSAMPQQNYSSLTKSERRQLADPLGRDGSIEMDGYPRLDLRFNQVEFKTPKHGPDHGLSTDDNGKTPKTEANALALRDSLIDMPNKPNVIWYKEGMYQGGTPRGCKSVNVFDPETNLIAVYQKYPNGTNLFLTTCKLTRMEIDHLKANNGNFVTERILNEQSAVSTQIIENTNNNNGLQ